MKNSFLGRGWSFPVSFNNLTREVDMLSDVADIESSLFILLSTKPGERVMQSSYGCNMDDLLFEPLNATTKTFIKDTIETAILYHEPRIRTDKIAIDDSRSYEGIIYISIDYTVLNSNSPFNFVYPFYLNS